MKFVLVDADWNIVRTTEATKLAEARFRLAPIPKHAAVWSLADWTRHRQRTAGMRAVPCAPNGSPLPNVKLREAIRHGVPRGVKQTAIAREFGVSLERVRQLRVAMGIPTRAEISVRNVLEAHDEGLPNALIAKRCNLAPSHVARILREHGRTKHPPTSRLYHTREMPNGIS